MSPDSVPPTTKFWWLTLNFSIYLTTLVVARDIASKDRINR